MAPQPHLQGAPGYRANERLHSGIGVVHLQEPPGSHDTDGQTPRCVEDLLRRVDGKVPYGLAPRFVLPPGDVAEGKVLRQILRGCKVLGVGHCGPPEAT